MNNDKIKKILSSVKSGGISVEGAVKKLKHFPYEDISFAKVDHHRYLRQGVFLLIWFLRRLSKE